MGEPYDGDEEAIYWDEHDWADAHEPVITCPTCGSTYSPESPDWVKVGDEYRHMDWGWPGVIGEPVVCGVVVVTERGDDDETE